MSVWAVFGTILVSGIAGGIGGAFMGDDFISKEMDDDGNPVIRGGKNVVILDGWAFSKRLLLGILAAFVVPLFLVLAAPGQNEGIIKKLMKESCPDISAVARFDSAAGDLSGAIQSSGLDAAAVQTITDRIDSAVTEITDAPTTEDAAGKCADAKAEWWNNLLILMGFCIVTALVAQRFLGSIADKLLKEVKESSDNAQRIAKGADAKSQKALDAVGSSQELDEAARNVLKAFVEVHKIPASSAEISKLVELEIDEVSDVLAILNEGGLIVQDAETKEWRLRGWGMMRARKEIGLSRDEFRVLGAIKDLPEKKPTEKILSKSLDLSQTKTARALQRLDRFGLVAESGSAKGGWRIKSWGKFALEEIRNK